MNEKASGKDRSTARMLAIGWTLVILGLCSIPGQDLPEITIFGFDKVLHMAMFAMFGWLWLRTAASTPSSRVAIVVIASGILYGIATEFYQEWLDVGRLMDPFDAVANSIGVTVVVVWRFFTSRRSET